MGRVYTKKIFKRSIAIFLCFTIVFNYSFSVLANENVESSEPEIAYTETIETTESSETIENIEEEIGEEVEEEVIEEEAGEENISSPSEIIDEPEEEENEIPADMVEELEEDEVIPQSQQNG